MVATSHKYMLLFWRSYVIFQLCMHVWSKMSCLKQNNCNGFLPQANININKQTQQTKYLKNVQKSLLQYCQASSVRIVKWPSSFVTANKQTQTEISFEYFIRETDKQQGRQTDRQTDTILKPTRVSPFSDFIRCHIRSDIGVQCWLVKGPAVFTTGSLD